MSKQEKTIEILGHKGKMVGGSKSLYQNDHPKDLVVFNSNVCTKEDGKIWYGDLNITESLNDLIKLSQELGTRIFVLYESDARFENEGDPKYDNAVCSVNGDDISIRVQDYTVKDGKVQFSPNMMEYGVNHEIQLSSLNDLRGNKKSHPLEELVKIIIKDLNLNLQKDEGINCCAIKCTTALENWLIYFIYDHSMKYDHTSHFRALQGAHMINGFNGPSTFYEKRPYWAKDDCIYVNTDKLVIKRNS